MLTCLGGNLLSCGGDVAGEPQLDDPELEEDIELVLCRDGIPCTSLRFTTYGNKN